MGSLILVTCAQPRSVMEMLLKNMVTCNAMMDEYVKLGNVSARICT